MGETMAAPGKRRNRGSRRDTQSRTSLFITGTARRPKDAELRDISQAGAYIYTPERWYPGTIVRIVLQGSLRAEQEDGTTAPAATTCVHARVVRHGPDGVGVEFAFHDKAESSAFGKFLAALPVQPAKTAPTPGSIPSRKGGQALVEFAVIVPLVFLLAVNAVNFGGFIFAWITVAGAARAGADYMVMSSESPGSPTPATLTQIKALVTSDVASLINKACIVVATCTNGTTAANGCTTFYRSGGSLLHSRHSGRDLYV